LVVICFPPSERTEPAVVVVSSAVDLKCVAQGRNLDRLADSVPQGVNNRNVHSALWDGDETVGALSTFRALRFP
jgi:hypothetical protein